MAASFTLPTVLANLTAGNQPLSLIDGDLTTLRDPLLSLNTFANFYTDIGAANAYVITVSAPQVVAQSAGLPIQFIAAAANTGASTLQINALAAKNIVHPDGSTLLGGEIPVGGIVVVQYDGTNYQLLSPTLSAVSTFRKNRLKNASFQVDSRGNSATSRADDVYGIDCWYTLTQTAAIQVTQQTLQENGQPYNIRITQNQAGAQRCGVAQIVEARDSQGDRGRAMTLTARIRCSSAQAIRYAILEWTGTADAVTSDVVNDWTSGTYTAGNFFLAANLTVTAVGSITPTANTWTAITPLKGTAGSSLNNWIVFVWTEGTAAQNVTLDVGLVQLAPGSIATPFEYCTMEKDVDDCQRYLPGFFVETVSTRGVLAPGTCVSTTHVMATFTLKTKTLVAPTAATVSAAADFGVINGADTGIAATAVSLAYSSQFAVTCDITVAAGLTQGQGSYVYGVTAGTSRIFFTGSEL